MHSSTLFIHGIIVQWFILRHHKKCLERFGKTDRFIYFLLSKSYALFHPEYSHTSYIVLWHGIIITSFIHSGSHSCLFHEFWVA